MSTAHWTHDDQEVFAGALKDHWGSLLAAGIAFVLLGVLGLISAVLLTIVSVVLFGALLIVGAAMQALHAYRATGWKGRLPHALIAVVYAMAGIVMIIDPLGASVALTIVLAAVLMVVGVARLFVAYQMRRSRGWGWAIAAGIASLLLAAIIFVSWPQSALWVIGLVVAIELLVNGWMCIFLALAARRT